MWWIKLGLVALILVLLVVNWWYRVPVCTCHRPDCGGGCKLRYPGK